MVECAEISVSKSRSAPRTSRKGADKMLGLGINEMVFAVRVKFQKGYSLFWIHKTNFFIKLLKLTFFHLCTAHSEICVVHSPTNALFIKLGKVLKFTLISLLHISIYDHHQGACTAPG